MRRTITSLSDGRDLIYFDDDATAATTSRDDVQDTRDLERTATSSEIRYDALLDEWVAVASHRQSRTYLPPADECPLCPSREGHPTEIPATDYDVVVFENRFPSFATDVELVADGVTRRRPPSGLGRCEVVCFTSNHDLPVSQLSPQRVRLILDAWVDRTDELGRLAVRRAGVLLREPRPGDRRHPQPPARPDLRLPVRDTADPRDARQRAPAPRAHRSGPVRRPAGGRARRREPGW